MPDYFKALCRCPVGKYYKKGSKCANCPAGTGGHVANPELRGRDGCLRCSQGTFATEKGVRNANHVFGDHPQRYAIMVAGTLGATSRAIATYMYERISAIV